MHVHDSNFSGRREKNQSTKIQMGGDFRLKLVQRKTPYKNHAIIEIMDTVAKIIYWNLSLCYTCSFTLLQIYKLYPKYVSLVFSTVIIKRCACY